MNGITWFLIFGQRTETCKPENAPVIVINFIGNRYSYFPSSIYTIYGRVTMINLPAPASERAARIRKGAVIP